MCHVFGAAFRCPRRAVRLSGSKPERQDILKNKLILGEFDVVVTSYEVLKPAIVESHNNRPLLSRSPSLRKHHSKRFPLSTWSLMKRIVSRTKIRSSHRLFAPCAHQIGCWSPARHSRYGFVVVSSHWATGLINWSRAEQPSWTLGLAQFLVAWYFFVVGRFWFLVQYGGRAGKCCEKIAHCPSAFYAPLS